MTGQLIAVAFFGLAAIGFGAGVFLTRSMVRSALALLAAMAALGGLFLALEAEFLGVLQLMMMGTEMTLMAIFMVMFMMDPGGLGQMEMTHQKRTARAAGRSGAWPRPGWRSGPGGGGGPALHQRPSCRIAPWGWRSWSA